MKYLIRDMEALIKADEPNAAIMYIIILCFAAMGIFNAQGLSIFRRGKEIGTLMALGMTRTKVVGLFTLEGGLNAFLAAIMTVILFGPLLWYFGNNGIWLGVDYSDGAMGIIKCIADTDAMSGDFYGPGSGKMAMKGNVIKFGLEEFYNNKETKDLLWNKSSEAIKEDFLI